MGVLFAQNLNRTKLDIFNRLFLDTALQRVKGYAAECETELASLTSDREGLVNHGG